MRDAEGSADGQVLRRVRATSGGSTDGVALILTRRVCKGTTEACMEASAFGSEQRG